VGGACAAELLRGLCLFEARALSDHHGGIDAAARLDWDLLSRGMSDLGSIRAHTRRYKELKGRNVTWSLPGLGKVMPGAGRRMRITGTPRGQLTWKPTSAADDPVNSTSTAISASFQSCSYSVCTSTGPLALILRENFYSELP
jgi:hypothetical protein